MALHLLQHDRDGARALGARARARGAARPPLRALQHVHRGRRLRAVPLRQARPVAAVRRRDARRSPHGGADPRLQRAVLRADGAPLAARRHRAQGDPPRPPDPPRDRRRRARGDPRDQLHQRGRGHGALHRASCSPRAGSRCRGWRAACRSAASSSTSTRARSPRRCATAGGRRLSGGELSRRSAKRHRRRVGTTRLTRCFRQDADHECGGRTGRQQIAGRGSRRSRGGRKSRERPASYAPRVAGTTRSARRTMIILGGFLTRKNPSPAQAGTRRKFLKASTGVAAAGATLGFPMIAKGQAAPIAMRWQSHVAGEGHLPRVRARLRQEGQRHDRRRAQDRGAAGRRGRPRLRPARRGVQGHARRRPRRARVPLRQAERARAVGLGPGLRHGREHAARLAQVRRRQGTPEQALRVDRRERGVVPVRPDADAAARLVQEADHQERGLQGPQVPHRRHLDRRVHRAWARR